jgi:20S proteasome subunit alpha 6
MAFRNQYDTDVTTFSPDGRLFQVEYAMEAVKHGTPCLGMRSNEYAILAAIKPSTSELASFQKKLFNCDSNLGIATSGIIADARVLARYCRDECLNHRYVFESEMPVRRLVTQLSDKSHVYTQQQKKRPYGVGLLVAGVDRAGTHIFETSPSGEFFEYDAQAIGKRSQAARTYLDNHFETFADADLKTLITHALTALKGSAIKVMTSQNVEVGVVSASVPFRMLDSKELDVFISQLDQAALEAAEKKAKETPEYLEGGDDNEDDDDDDEAPAAKP